MKELFNRTSNLRNPNAAEKLRFAVGEEHGHNLPYLAPVRTIGCEPKTCLVVRHVFDGDELGARAHDDVVCGVAFLGHFRVAENQSAFGTELDGEEGSIFVGHGCQRLVGCW